MNCYNEPMLTRAYEEMIDFIAAGTKPADIVGYKPSEETNRRVADLLRRQQSDGLSGDERDELDNYLQLEHFMRLAKAKARLHLARQTPAHAPAAG